MGSVTGYRGGGGTVERKERDSEFLDLEIPGWIAVGVGLWRMREREMFGRIRALIVGGEKRVGTWFL